MITIRVLLENSACSPSLRKAHGLSLLVETKGHSVLLDLGPNATFAQNAVKMGLNLATVEAVVLSHAHRDHVGGLDAFCLHNTNAPIYLRDRRTHRYFAKVGPLLLPVGLRASRSSLDRITELSEEQTIFEGVTLLGNTVHSYGKPKANRSLWKREGPSLSRDDFRHEGILVCEDADELVIFNSCSHNGFWNALESVKLRFPGRRIRSYVGGLHLTNPVTGSREPDALLERLARCVEEEELQVFTGHCTGDRCLRFLSNRSPRRFHRLSTGLVALV